MREAWERLIGGPPDSDRSVLLLPGGACAARSFDLVMAESALSGVRLVATTLPGMAGAAVTEEVSIPEMARRAGELAKDNGCDVVVGFSYGATVALDMVLMPMMARSAKTSEEHKNALIEDFTQNRASDAVRVCGEYLDYIAADRDFAAELAASGNPVWVVHAQEKGDGGLTDDERATLEAAPNVTLVTIPGAVFLIPDEAPQRTAAVIADALKQAT